MCSLSGSMQFSTISKDGSKPKNNYAVVNANIISSFKICGFTKPQF